VPFATTADACDREAAFLNLTTDGLPILPVSAGGKWDLVQAYRPRTPAARKNQIYVTRSDFAVDRTANQRSMASYALELQLLWTLSLSSGSAEQAQRDFDAAIDDVVKRVLGTPPGFQGGIGMDKTHDGKFLSAAENPRRVQVRILPPEKTISPGAYLEAQMVYMVDDYDFND
jgi:hypothetical protein